MTNNKKAPKKLLKSFFGAIGDPVGSEHILTTTIEEVYSNSKKFLNKIWNSVNYILPIELI